MKFIQINRKFANYLFLLLPIFLLTGSFLPDLAVVLIVIFFLIEIFFKKKLLFFKNKIFLFLFLFCIYISLVSVFSENRSSSMISSFFYIRFPIFALAVSYYLKEEEKLINSFFYILLFSTILLSVDLYVQRVFFIDLIGNYAQNHINIETKEKIYTGRFSGFFGKEYIAGSYLARLFPILLTLFFYINFKKKKFIRSKIIFLTIIFLVAIIITTERNALAMFLLSMLLFIFLIKKYRFFFVKLLFLLLISCFIFIYNNSFLKNRFYEDIKKNSFTTNKEIYFFSKGHHAHIMSAYAIFKDNFFFGVGLKNYRVYCLKPQYNIEYNSCTTHPHNIPIQFLAEIGIFGFFFYLFSLFYLIKNLFLFIFKKNYDDPKKNYLNLMLIPLLINLFPFLPSGNFFHNWLSVITYLPLAFYLFAINKR